MLFICDIISDFFKNMVSKIVHTTSCTIKCTICGKSMLLKTWKDQCRQFHAMSQTAIDCKYYELKRDIEQAKLSTVTFDATINSEKPNPMLINTLFSMKKFALVKSTITNENTQAADVDNQIKGTPQNRLATLQYKFGLKLSEVNGPSEKRLW